MMSMDKLLASTPQTSFLPLASADARSQSFRRQSVPVIYEGPITPPVSPGHIEDCSHGAKLPDHEMQPDLPIPASSDGLAQADHPSCLLETPPPQEQRSVTPSNKPARLLEDEPNHIAKPGVLRLSDFEVRGALGNDIFSFFHSCPRLIMCRYGYVRAGTTRSHENCHPWVSERLCNESAAQIRDSPPPPSGTCERRATHPLARTTSIYCGPFRHIPG